MSNRPIDGFRIDAVDILTMYGSILKPLSHLALPIVLSLKLLELAFTTVVLFQFQQMPAYHHLQLLSLIALCTAHSLTCCFLHLASSPDCFTFSSFLIFAAFFLLSLKLLFYMPSFECCSS